MQAALDQAALGVGRTSPNPAVGCVILDSSGARIAEGFHERAGEPHAEIAALRRAGPAARGGTLYVTLEPCSHHGRTPPCVDAILQAGVERVVAAMVDPDPRVSGQGLSRLREAGLQVEVGVGERAARRLNEGYLKVKATGLPFVLLKMAMTLDGKIATHSGDSRWVTSPPARSHVQELRDQYDAVLVGIGTVLADDPALTVRSEELRPTPGRTPRNPARVILDSRARLPVTAKVLQPGRCLILVGRLAPADAIHRLEAAGAEVLIVEDQDGRVHLPAAMRRLAEAGINSVLMEGGAEVAAAALEAGMVDRLLFFLAPRIIGGSTAPGPVGGAGRDRMADSIPTGRLRIRRFGPDIAIEADLQTAPKPRTPRQ